MIIRLRGKLIEQSEAGKCLVIGTIMADCLIIKQQKISVFLWCTDQIMVSAYFLWYNNGNYLCFVVRLNLEKLK